MSIQPDRFGTWPEVIINPPSPSTTTGPTWIKGGSLILNTAHVQSLLLNYEFGCVDVVMADGRELTLEILGAETHKEEEAMFTRLARHLGAISVRPDDL